MTGRKKILLSDESMFCVPHGNQGICVWRSRTALRNKKRSYFQFEEYVQILI